MNRLRLNGTPSQIRQPLSTRHQRHASLLKPTRSRLLRHVRRVSVQLAIQFLDLCGNAIDGELHRMVMSKVPLVHSTR
jgi:hypothetical protein